MTRLYGGWSGRSGWSGGSGGSRRVIVSEEWADGLMGGAERTVEACGQTGFMVVGVVGVV